MSADVIAMIKTDHHELERLFDMMEEDSSSRPLVLPLAVAMLTAHSRAEEDHVYPALAKEAGEKDEAEHGMEEHHKAEQLGQQLLGKDPEGPDFEESFSEWVSAVQHHVEEEETELLPHLQEALDADRLTELGQAFAARRAAELTGQARQPGNGNGRRGGSRAGKSPGRSSQDKTKDQLLTEARKAGIQGRSSMSKDELLRALSSKH
jgi:hemerythrin superfamily protein